MITEDFGILFYSVAFGCSSNDYSHHLKAVGNVNNLTFQISDLHCNAKP